MTDEFYVRLGAKIREAREGARLTQADLSGRVGLSRSSIANIEAGRQAVYLHQMVDIAFALGRSISKLVPVDAVAATDLASVEADSRAIHDLIEGSDTFVVGGKR